MVACLSRDAKMSDNFLLLTGVLFRFVKPLIFSNTDWDGVLTFLVFFFESPFCFFILAVSIGGADVLYTYIVFSCHVLKILKRKKLPIVLHIDN